VFPLLKTMLNNFSRTGEQERKRRCGKMSCVTQSHLLDIGSLLLTPICWRWRLTLTARLLLLFEPSKGRRRLFHARASSFRNHSHSFLPLFHLNLLFQSITKSRVMFHETAECMLSPATLDFEFKRNIYVDRSQFHIRHYTWHNMYLREESHLI
jgi:hypothetical protein